MRDLRNEFKAGEIKLVFKDGKFMFIDKNNKEVKVKKYE